MTASPVFLSWLPQSRQFVSALLSGRNTIVSMATLPKYFLHTDILEVANRIGSLLEVDFRRSSFPIASFSRTPDPVTVRSVASSSASCFLLLAYVLN